MRMLILALVQRGFHPLISGPALHIIVKFERDCFIPTTSWTLKAVLKSVVEAAVGIVVEQS